MPWLNILQQGQVLPATDIQNILRRYLKKEEADVQDLVMDLCSYDLLEGREDLFSEVVGRLNEL